jgi:hypothetical protein
VVVQYFDISLFFILHFLDILEKHFPFYIILFYQLTNTILNCSIKLLSIMSVQHKMLEVLHYSLSEQFSWNSKIKFYIQVFIKNTILLHFLFIIYIIIHKEQQKGNYCNCPLWLHVLSLKFKSYCYSIISTLLSLMHLLMMINLLIITLFIWAITV